MFKAINITLAAPLADTGTLVLEGHHDVFRTAKDGHIWMNKSEDTRFTAPEHFSLSIDGDGTCTITWENADVQDAGDVIVFGLAYIDQLTGGSTSIAAGGGGGGGDASAANQVTEIARLTSIRDATDTVETLIAATNTKLDTLDTRVDGLEGLMTAANALLTTINASLDDIEAAAESTLPTSVVSGMRPVNFIPGIDATALAIGDVIFDTELINAVTRAIDTPTAFAKLTCVDQSDSKPEIHFFLLQANNSLGTENAAPSISDANSYNIVGHAWIAAGAFSSSNINGWVDVGGASRATALIVGGPEMFNPVTGDDAIYAAAITGTAVTFGSTGALKFILGMLD